MLSCDCYCGGDYEWWYLPPDDFSQLETKRRRRCKSCKELISIGANCMAFECYTYPRSDIEERIYGDEVPMANRYICEKCGEIYLNLTSLGYCYYLGDNLADYLKEYWELTGFLPHPTKSAPVVDENEGK